MMIMLQELVYAKLHKVVKNSSLCDWSFLLFNRIRVSKDTLINI